jgi:putative ABC transport system permease protein
LAVTELEKALELGRLVFKSPPVDGASKDGVFVSESFALHFKKNVGDRILLPTSLSSLDMPVLGVYYDYASNQGTILMDASMYEQNFADHHPSAAPQNLSIYLREGADVEAVRRRILALAGDEERIYCVTYSEVRSEALRIFDSTFVITYALQVIAVVVAGLGVASTLITLIYQRQREIGLLSLVGATPGQIRRVIVGEAVIVGGVSQLMGILIGILMAMVLIYVINVQSFGWTIQFHLPIRFLLQSTLLVVGGSALFALYPAVQAANVRALQTVREE